MGTSLININRNTVYLDNVQDKELICVHLKNKLVSALVKSDAVKGNKNLVYFTVSGDESYIQLLEICLKSIVKYTPNINFDVLFITQQSFVDKIKALSVVSNFTYDFHIVSDPISPVRASMKKLKIFSYKNIDQYSNVLFLDCDIICTKPLSDVFSSQFESGYIHVASNPAVSMASWETGSVFASLDYITPEQKSYVESNSILPFNAGQFLFKNTEKMKAHFANVLWLVDVWPGKYYFEQSFMNFYFTLNGLSRKNILNSRVAFVRVISVTQTKQPTGFFSKLGGEKLFVVPQSFGDDKSLYRQYPTETPASLDTCTITHFFGASANSAKKISFINGFLKNKNICL